MAKRPTIIRLREVKRKKNWIDKQCQKRRKTSHQSPQINLPSHFDTTPSSSTTTLPMHAFVSPAPRNPRSINRTEVGPKHGLSIGSSS